jgi:4-azaleucine resistance transporter AzlC
MSQWFDKMKVSEEEISRNQRQAFTFAFVQTLPILFSYLFLSLAFGIMMQEAGFSIVWAWLISLTVYTGAFQFVLVSFLSAGTNLVTVALTALAMNSRHIFYGVTFLEEFKKMGRRYPYMIFSLTDETYALNCSITIPEELDREQVLFYIAHLSRIYWMTGTIAGALIGKWIPFDFQGIDFCMTALFVTIFIDQWKSASSHVPALTGLISSVLFLILLGADSFLLPALAVTTAILILTGKKEVAADEN